MEDNRTLFRYIGQWFSTYGTIVTIFLILGMVIGEQANGSSSLFALGNQGLSIQTLVQLLLFSLIITVTQIAFLTDKWIKNMPLLIRNIMFFGIIIVAIVIFVVVFAWFPIDEIKAWIGFGLFFAVCTAISVTASRQREKCENRKMEQALNNFKGKSGGTYR